MKKRGDFDDGQGDLNFDGEEHGAARWDDPPTSQDAAESINPAYLYGVIRDTLAWAYAHPEEAAHRCGIPVAQALLGLQSHEIAHLSKITCGREIGYGSITPRMTHMRKKDWIYDTGATRPWRGAPNHPASTRQSTVWQLASLRPEAEKIPVKNADPPAPKALYAQKEYPD